MAARVVIVGGGITGLVTAYELARLGAGADVTLLERSGRLGGNLITEREQGFLMDGGPDSWVVTKPHATALARELGMEGDLVPTRPETRRVYIAHGGRLHVLPEGLVLGVPTKISPMITTRLFSWSAKLRMAIEPLVPARRWADGDDESIGDFLTRRLGREVADRLAGPLLGGIFAGDPFRLSMRATFPQFVDAERTEGSLVRAMTAQRLARATKDGKPGSAFTSLRGGLGSLVDGVVGRLGETRVRTGVGVAAVGRAEAGDARGRLVVELDGGERLHADHVLLAAPAPAVAPIVGVLDADLAARLGAIYATSTATVFLAFRRAEVAHPLDGVGFLVPRSEGRKILAGTWVSSKWAGRAPDDHVLVRAFFGGVGREEILERDDAGLASIARDELRAIMGLEAEPIFSRVFRFVRASPQPEVGHLARMAEIRARVAAHPGLYLAGNGYDGIGIPECVRQAREIAARIAGESRVAAPPRASATNGAP